MLFWGSKDKTILGTLAEGVECPHCDNHEFFTFSVLKYFHLTHIPTLLTSKNIGMECTHCKEVLMDQEIPDDLAHIIKRTLLRKKHTLPMFTGLALIVAMLIGVLLSEQHTSVQAQAAAQGQTVSLVFFAQSKM